MLRIPTIVVDILCMSAAGLIIAALLGWQGQPPLPWFFIGAAATGVQIYAGVRRLDRQRCN